MSRLNLLFIALASIMFIASTPAKTPTAKKNTALLLAQTCVAEISFHHHKDTTKECALMWEINGRNARRSGRTIDYQTKLFNAYWKDPDKNRPWIQHLNTAGTKPQLWDDASASWTVHKPIWNNYLAAAEKFLKQFKSKKYRPICKRADDYGGRCDDNGLHACDTPKLNCAKPIWCLRGRTHQAYWDKACCRNPKSEKCAGRQ